MNGAIETALWAELYPTLQLGAIKKPAHVRDGRQHGAQPGAGGVRRRGRLAGELLTAAVATTVIGNLLATRLWAGMPPVRPPWGSR